MKAIILRFHVKRLEGILVVVSILNTIPVPCISILVVDGSIIFFRTLTGLFVFIMSTHIVFAICRRFPFNRARWVGNDS